ncbi:MAG: EthD family reductase [SAR324 cluster bacterium]
MFKISILCPNTEGIRFDWDYLVHRHIPLVESRLRPLGLLGTAAEKGVQGAAAGSAAPFHCMAHMLFETLEAYKAAMKAHGKELVADIAKFTNAAPVIQISEIVS